MVTRVLQVVRGKRFRTGALVAAAGVTIFVLGVLTGNGSIRLVPPGNYQDRTGLPSSIDYSSVTQLYDVLRQNYDGKLTSAQVLDGLKHGLAQSTGDPYTEYFTAQEAADFSGELEGTFTGIGAQLERDTNGNIVIVAPLDGSPAATAGLRAKDVVISINGESTSGITAGQAVTKIRGPKGTSVQLEVVRGDNQRLSFTITRNTIQLPTATSKVLDNNIGYLQVSQFSSGTPALVQQAVTSFKQAGVKKVILDLRDNPGGEVTTAQQLASLWLKPDTLIMQERRGTQVVDEIRANGDAPLMGMPTVVLINAGSASASEITALALRDNAGATLIGEKSYGKGVVQQILPLGDGGQLKVTVASWYSPKGTNINKKGITPDTTVSISDADYASGTDPQLAAAESYLQQK